MSYCASQRCAAWLDLPTVKRFANYSASTLLSCSPLLFIGTFAFYFPKIWRRYTTTMDELQCKYPELRRPFLISPFPAVSINFGPDSVCYEHTDAGNLAPGICAIYSGGDFDPKQGGHFVLRTLGIAIQFPAGSLALIPSAVLEHGNTSIHPCERCWAITFYAAAGLFRHLRWRCMTMPELLQQPEILKQVLQEDATQWEEDIHHFSTMDGLQGDRELVFPAM